ncbi:hypothetical protein [Xanthomonas bonasiae]|uniref:hypothetical protein n=1 Tax=Xanthomonas bonasiae TaxID=2810351 RepID=UPI0017828548|nr:hypothetical protein [Xanthomonas surreyensis]MBD7924220.1 hypothetical protein [Xanthomonas surreyensis]
MRLQLHANMVDRRTSKVADALRPVFTALSDRVSGDYGGFMEHLWIDLELIEDHAKPDGTPRHPFRFQKRVSGRSPPFGLPPVPDKLNVGHFSVRPDFERIITLPTAQAVAYAVFLIYQGTDVLHAKAKRLGGFDANLFRSRFRDIAQELGYQCDGWQCVGIESPLEST